ncbi:hypothetical protein Tco_0783637 [Tanacetum coccineum]
MMYIPHSPGFSFSFFLIQSAGTWIEALKVSYTLTKWYQSQAMIKAEDGKVKIDNMMVMILVSVGCRSKTLCIKRSFRNLWQKPNLQPIASKDKEVNMAAGDSDDALVCCIENTVEDRIMDSGASFHATYCKEELERFKLHSSKVRLANDKTLDIARIGDVVLKTSFDTSWTLKDVRYIPSLKRRLISIGQLDEGGYHVGFGDQQLKVTKGSLVVARGNKRGSRWFGEAEESFLHNVSEDKKTVETAARVTNGIVMLKIVPEKPPQFGVAERLSRTFIAESTGIRAESSKIGSDEMQYSFRDTKSHQKSQMVLLDIPENLAENDSIITEHELSSEINQSPGGSSDTSEGSENSGSFKDSGRSDEEYSEDGSSSKEVGSETSQVRISTRESKAPVRFLEQRASVEMFTKVGVEREVDVLCCSQLVQKRIPCIESLLALHLVGAAVFVCSAVQKVVYLVGICSLIMDSGRRRVLDEIKLHQNTLASLYKRLEEHDLGVSTSCGQTLAGGSELLWCSDDDDCLD